jgi:hypothetical protein
MFSTETLLLTYLHAVFPVYAMKAYIYRKWSQDSSVGIPTRYGLDGPGIESRVRVIFPASVQNGSGSHLASYTMGPWLYPRVKWPGRSVYRPLPYSAEAEEGTAITLLPSWPSWPVLGGTWTLYTLFVLDFPVAVYRIASRSSHLQNFNKQCCRMTSNAVWVPLVAEVPISIFLLIKNVFHVTTV